MKDIEKTSVDRVNSRKRIRRRRRFMNVYIAAVLLLVAVIGFAVSYTFLFNISEIKVSGESDMYSAEQIAEASGIREGDNLLRTDTDEGEAAILQQLTYIESVDIKRNFPFTLEISVTKCIPSYNVNCGSKNLLISKKGKILAENNYITDGVPTIYGYMPISHLAGEHIKSDDELKDAAFNSLINSIGKLEDVNISSISMADEHDIVINYKNGMEFRMGNWNDVDYKLNLAATVMEQESVKGKKGCLTMIGANQIGFRMAKNSSSIKKNSNTSKNKTDANGNPVSDGNEPSGEQNPEQDALFSDYNNRDTSDGDFFNWDTEITSGTENTTDADGGYYDENGIYHDQYGGYLDSWGNYHDQYGGYYDSYGNYYDQYGNPVTNSWDSGYSDDYGW